MLTINLQKLQRYLDKVGLIMVVSFSDKEHRLEKFYVTRKSEWERVFKGKFSRE